VFPTALLETRGARTGELRRNAIIYFHDDDRVTIVASNAGDARHPAWFHNLLADPDVTFAGEPMRAEWVRRLSDAQQNATHDDSAKMEEGPLVMLVGLLGMLSVPGYFVLQALFGLRWTGGWRVAALVPLAIMVPAIGHAAFALAAGSNLWPIVVIFCAPVGFIYLVVVALARYFGGGRRQAAA